jgi:multidrug efflux pump subunit AcrA (membrane-fusion protein)
MSLRRRCFCLAAACLAAGISGHAIADDPPTHTVTRVPFRLEAKIDGILESTAMAEVRLDAKRWTSYIVETAVPHGTRVNKGDVLIRFQTAAIDEQIRDLEIGERIAAMTHGLLERELALLEKATPAELARARRARRITAEDLARYEAKERQIEAELNDLLLRMSEFRRESAEEELDQLEKMYAQDDLTEETEEIVLKRARFDAEVSRFSERQMQDRHERSETLELPRQLEAIKQANLAAALDLERAEKSLPVALDKLRLEIERSTFERRKAAKHVAELRADRAAMPLVAPTDGIVYYGRWQQGKWVEADQVAGRLRVGSRVEPQMVFFTIVGSGRLFVRAGVPEQELFKVAPDLPAIAVPKAYPDMRLAGRVRSVTTVPVAAGKFEAVVDLAEDSPRLAAGMETAVRVSVAKDPALLAVPKKGVFTEPLDDDKTFVYVVASGGKKPQKRTVATGRSNDEVIEITAGLSEGEEILLENPKATETKHAKPRTSGGDKKSDKKTDEGKEKPEDTSSSEAK